MLDAAWRVCRLVEFCRVVKSEDRGITEDGVMVEVRAITEEGCITEGDDITDVGDILEEGGMAETGVMTGVKVIGCTGDDTILLMSVSPNTSAGYCLNNKKKYCDFVITLVRNISRIIDTPISQFGLVVIDTNWLPMQLSE